ncbi:MAG: PAS domain-containing protein, partial [Arenimonas sp.]
MQCAGNEPSYAVFDRITDAYVALDREWRYTYVNARAGELLLREPGELVGRHIWTEFPEGADLPFARAYRQAMETQRPV